MNTPTQTLRVVFSLSALACSVVLVLFVRGRAEWTDAFWLQLAAASVALCVAGCFVAFRNGGLRLEAVPLGRFILVFLRQLAITYIASGVAVSVLALAVIYAITRSGPNALALAVLVCGAASMGLWYLGTRLGPVAVPGFAPVGCAVLGAVLTACTNLLRPRA